MTYRMHALAAFLILVAPLAVAGQEPGAADFIRAIEGAQGESSENGLGDLTIEQLMERFHVPGISVAVIRDSEVHWAKGYGVADVETGAPVDTETLFQAASISKPVAAMAVLKAVQDGVFGLDDDINTILTSWTLEGGDFTRSRPVTPRSLTSHTSGLGDGFGFPGYDPSDPLPTPVQILEGHEWSNVGPVFMERSPFSFAEYSGGGVTVMQVALSDARRRPFPEILQDDVLGPIGMANSTFEQPLSPEWDRNATRAHDSEGRAMGPKWHVYPELAAAGLWTTATDLARFAIEVQKSAQGESNRVLSRGMVREMLTPVGVGGFAVGFSVAKMGEGWYFSHGGGNWGFRCILMAHYRKGYGLAIMTNADQGGAVMTEVSRRIQEVYEWDSVADPVRRGYDPPEARTEVELPVEVLEDYVGAYQVEGVGLIEVTVDDGLLYGAVAGDRERVYAEAVDEFFLDGGQTVSFERGEDGTVTAMTVRVGGREMMGPKVR